MGLRSSQFNTAPRGETFEYLEGECNIALTVIKYVVKKKILTFEHPRKRQSVI